MHIHALGLPGQQQKVIDFVCFVAANALATLGPILLLNPAWQEHDGYSIHVNANIPTVVPVDCVCFGGFTSAWAIRHYLLVPPRRQ